MPVRDTTSALWALLFIALLYTSAPAIAVFARYNLMESVRDASWSVSAETNDDPSIKPLPEWVRSWEDIGLIAWVDKDGDGAVDYAPGAAFVGKPSFVSDEARGDHGERMLVNEPTEAKNELTLIGIYLANQKFRPSRLGGGLVAAGGLAAALSTAAGLLVVSTSISHDLLAGCFSTFLKRASCGPRIAIAGAVVAVGWGSIPRICRGSGARFGLPPAIFPRDAGYFQHPHEQVRRRGMVTGLFTPAATSVAPASRTDTGPLVVRHWPQSIGSVGMVLNFVVSGGGACFPAPPAPKTCAGHSAQSAVLRHRTDPNYECSLHARCGPPMFAIDSPRPQLAADGGRRSICVCSHQTSDSTAQLAGHGAFVSAGNSDRDAHHHVARGQHEIVHRSGGVPPVVVLQPCFGGALHHGARRGGLHSTL